MIGENKVRVSVTIDKRLKVELDKIAKATKTSVSETLTTLCTIGMLAVSKTNLEKMKKEEA